MIRDEVLRSFSGSNVVVTGGTGMIGRQVVHMLCRAGAHVRVVSLDNLLPDPGAEYVHGDLTNSQFCEEVTKDTDFVFHIAGVQGSVAVSETKVASHFVPTLMMNTNILEACRINKVRKVVYTSSIGAYSDAEVLRESDYRLETRPMDFAGWAKRMAEFQIHAYNVEYGMTGYSAVRPSAVYGPGDNFDPTSAMVIPALMNRILNKEDPVVVWGDGTAVRDFTYSRDVAEGVILALYHGTAPHLFVNLGSGNGCSIRLLVETLDSFLDFNYVFDTTKPAGFPKRVMDISLARRIVDYNPSTFLLEGLRETWDWYVNNRDEYLKKKNYFREK